MRRCAEITVTIPRDALGREAALLDLHGKLASLSPGSFAEVWVDHGPYPAICALMNGNRGWLMWVRHEGDAGFSSRNPSYSGPPDDEIEYMLSNGQVDRYPASWAYSQEEIFAALEAFARLRRISGISWFNDSQDGLQEPEGGSRAE